jgi:molecular chaperone DnaK
MSSRLSVCLPYHDETEFTERGSASFSVHGMFLDTEHPLPPGTRVSFVVSLASGVTLMEGTAEVVRQALPYPGTRAGMALRFVALGEEGRARLEQLVPLPVLPNGDLTLGVDFGACSTRIAVLRDGRPELVPLGKDTFVPSAIAIDPQGRLLVGGRAKAQAASEPGQSVLGAKRWLGRSWEAVSADLPNEWHWVRNPDGLPAAELRGKPCTMVWLCGEILRKARSLAEESLGARVTRVAIGVPSRFDEAQRLALRQAALHAGLAVELLVQEPVAAAVALRGKRSQARRRLAVIDLGGAGFGASIVEVQGKQVRLVASSGDTKLGGMDFDERIAGLLRKKFEEHTQVSLVGEVVANQRILAAAEQAKIDLCSKEEARVHLPVLVLHNGTPLTLDVRLRRLEVDSLCQDLLDRALQQIDRVLAGSKLTKASIDDVLLVGGMAQIPLARRRVEEFFGKPCVAGLDPSGAVAFGAALLGTASHRQEHDLGLRDLLCDTLYAQLPDGTLRTLLEPFTPLPAERHMALDGPLHSHVLRLPFFVGRGRDPAEDEYLGALELHGIVLGPSGKGRVALTASLACDGTFHVQAGSGEAQTELQARVVDSTHRLKIAYLDGRGEPSGSLGSPGRPAGS